MVYAKQTADQQPLNSEQQYLPIHQYKYVNAESDVNVDDWSQQQWLFFRSGESVVAITPKRLKCDDVTGTSDSLVSREII